MIEAIILAGGKGTRLRSVVADLPKPMADIAGSPFLYYQMAFLHRQGVSRFVLAVGYMHEKVSEYFGNNFEGVPVDYVIEESPLGTGGGIKYALEACKGDNVLVCNGDTFFEFNLDKLIFAHKSYNSPFTFSVRKVYNTGRYGGMKIDDEARVKAFVSKDEIGDTYINTGAYIINRASFISSTEGLIQFSLEDEYLAKKITQNSFYAVPFKDANFLDIGIPEDYEKGQTLIPNWIGAKAEIIESIFLDRDGVINRKIDDGYVKNVNELEFINGSLEWIASNSKKRILVVTNQRGVGRGLMSEEDLQKVHEYIATEVIAKGGQIGKFYYCTAIENTSLCRKPNPGMLLEASHDFPDITKKTSILIGDSLSDLQAANNFGCKAVFLTNGKSLTFEQLEFADEIKETLKDFILH